MGEDRPDTVIFDCPACGERVSGRYGAGVPDQVHCPNCATELSVEEIERVDDTVRTQAPDTDEIDRSRHGPGAAGGATMQGTGAKASSLPRPSDMSQRAANSDPSDDDAIDGAFPSVPDPVDSLRATSDVDQPEEVDPEDQSLKGASVLSEQEILDLLGDRSLYLRTERGDFGPVRRDQFVEIVQQGRLEDVEALREPDQQWLDVDRHPLIAEIRQKLAEQLRRELAAAQQQVGDALDDMTIEEPAPAPEFAFKPDDPSGEDEISEPEQRRSTRSGRPVTANADATTEETRPAFGTRETTSKADADSNSDRREATSEPDPELTLEGDGAGNGKPPADSGSHNDPSRREPQGRSQPSADERGKPTVSNSETTEKRNYEPTPGEVTTDEGGRDEWTLLGLGKWGLVAVLVAALGAGGAAAFVAFKMTAEKPAADDEKVEEKSPPTEVVEAYEQATDRVRTASDVDVEDPDLQRRVARRLGDRGRHDDASRIYDHTWREHHEPGDREVLAAYLETLESASQWGRLREVALAAIEASDDDETYRAKFAKSLRKDPELGNYQTVVLGSDSEVEALRPADDRDVSGWLVVRDGEPTQVFRPASREGPEWRDDIAAWRLCHILRCPFSIPPTGAAKISRKQFERLAGDASVPDDLEWRDEKDSGGDEREWVYGSVRKWSDEAVRWPVERTELWRPWLGIWSERVKYNEPAVRALRPLRELDDGALYDELKDHVSGLVVRDLARQLGTIVAFDFLTNNWGRFADEPGAHNHLRNGRFVTIWTDTVFQGRKSRRVKGRFEWIQRFSRQFVTAVELLDEDATRAALYPEETATTGRKFDVFWEQRDALLERVEELVQEHGRKEVLFFK